MTITLQRLLPAALVPAALLGLTAYLVGCASKPAGEEDVPYPRTPNYKYSELIVKDYDEMRAMVQAQIRKAQSGTDEAESIDHLRAALKLIFTRPDSDNMVAKLVTDVRRELTGFGAFERVVAQIAAEATDNLRNKEATLSVRTSASFILENLLTEVRPEAERENGDMRKTVRRLADARLDLPRDVKSERKLRGMFLTTNPSEDAAKIIEAIAARDKRAQEAAEKLKKKK